MALPWLILGSGSRSSKIKIAPTVFARLPGARIVNDLSSGV
jgi:prolyl-tRNA editing enzyme YbaK/EbsC (Cys-tRNA(Pro) deacylase)